MDEHAGPITTEADMPRRSPLLLVVGVLFLAGGVAVGAWGVQTAYDARRLNGAGAERTTAQITASQIMTSATNRSTVSAYQLRYRFSANGERYTAEDDIWIFDQDDVWVEVPKRTYDAARERGELEVEYLSARPGVNQPVEAPRTVWAGAVFLVAGLVAAAIGLLLSAGALRRVARPRRQA